MPTHTATYTERYISAATRTLPERSRDDLTAELEASIADAIAARVDAGDTAATAERAVLTDLGDPAKLAADYADRPLTLIGPRYFLDWWRTLKLLLWIVPACAAVGVAIAQGLTGAGIGEIIGAIAATLVSVIVHVGFWVTAIFAVLERTQPHGKAPLLPWDLDQLPELRTPGLGRADMIASLVFLALVPIALLWDRFVGFVFIRGESVPLVDPALWPWVLIVLAPILLAEGALAVAVYRRGRWTPAFAIINTVLAVLVAATAIWLISSGMLVNPAFMAAVAGGTAVAPIVTAIICVSIAGIAAWDVFDGWFKMGRDRRS